ncbi:MAG: NAD-dependent DNA ligase LigA, partial [Microthrixaceae bacterium]
MSITGPDSELDPAGRVDWLRENIQVHNRAYYEQDSPLIADVEYDELLRELRFLEDAHPDLITPDSPTQSGVGGSPSTQFSPVKHSFR